MLWSLPARGVWIEINNNIVLNRTESSRSPQGECGLKSYYPPINKGAYAPSLPARGVWIEIILNSVNKCTAVPSLPARGVWIEICRCTTRFMSLTSLPARGVWIEIVLGGLDTFAGGVAPRKGSVD